jgi:hypothetical protein
LNAFSDRLSFFGSDFRVPIGHQITLTREIATGDIVDFISRETAPELHTVKRIFILHFQVEKEFFMGLTCVLRLCTRF